MSICHKGDFCTFRERCAGIKGRLIIAVVSPQSSVGSGLIGDAADAGHDVIKAVLHGSVIFVQELPHSLGIGGFSVAAVRLAGIFRAPSCVAADVSCAGVFRIAASRAVISRLRLISQSGDVIIGSGVHGQFRSAGDRKQCLRAEDFRIGIKDGGFLRVARIAGLHLAEFRNLVGRIRARNAFPGRCRKCHRPFQHIYIAGSFIVSHLRCKCVVSRFLRRTGHARCAAGKSFFLDLAIVLLILHLVDDRGTGRQICKRHIACFIRSGLLYSKAEAVSVNGAALSLQHVAYLAFRTVRGKIAGRAGGTVEHLIAAEGSRYGVIARFHRRPRCSRRALAFACHIGRDSGEITGSVVDHLEGDAAVHRLSFAQGSHVGRKGHRIAAHRRVDDSFPLFLYGNCRFFRKHVVSF